MDIAITDTEKLLEGVKIPPAPEVLVKLQQALQKRDPSMQEIAGAISQDVGMAALVLRTVNSPFFGLRSKVASIQQATSLLGIKNTSNIVAGLALRRTMEQSGDAPPHFWDSPVNVAMVSADVARRISRIPSDEAYLLGLFHNAGHAVLMQRFPDYGSFLGAAINDPAALVTELEDARYQTQHCVVGYLLARTWGLDKAVANVIRDHHNTPELLRGADHDPRSESMRLCILKIAEHIDKLYWGMDPDHEWEAIKADVLEYLGMSEPDFDDLRADMMEKLVSGG